jgi:hypothetical protein
MGGAVAARERVLGCLSCTAQWHRRWQALVGFKGLQPPRMAFRHSVSAFDEACVVVKQHIARWLGAMAAPPDPPGSCRSMGPARATPRAPHSSPHTYTPSPQGSRLVELEGGHCVGGPQEIEKIVGPKVVANVSKNSNPQIRLGRGKGRRKKLVGLPVMGLAHMPAGAN